MRYALPFATNWVFGFVFRGKPKAEGEPGEALPAPDDVKVETADSAIATAEIVEGGKVRLKYGSIGSTTGKLSSMKASHDGVNPLEVVFNIDCAPDSPDHVDLDAGAPEAAATS